MSSYLPLSPAFHPSTRNLHNQFASILSLSFYKQAIKDSFSFVTHNGFSILRKRTCQSLILGLVLLLFCYQLFSVLNFHLFSASSSNALSSSLSSPEFTRMVSQLKAEQSTYNPLLSIAYAITLQHSMQSSTDEAKMVEQIIRNLKVSGVEDQHIFLFEDHGGSESNSEQLNHAALQTMLTQYPALHIINTHTRTSTQTEAASLSQHYMFILDQLLQAPDTGAETDAIDFTVLIPSDLMIAADFTKYFQQLSRVMRVDPSVLLVSSASVYTTRAVSHEQFKGTGLTETDLHFLRIEHVHATNAAWMIRRTAYEEVRGAWMQAISQQQSSAEPAAWSQILIDLLRNRHTIIPTVSRSLSAATPAHILRKHRLSTAQRKFDYPDLSRLLQIGYNYYLQTWLSTAIRISVLDQALAYRHEKLVYVVQAKDDRDAEWMRVLWHFFGVDDSVRIAKYQTVRGVFKGTVLLHYVTNPILLVATYSPFMSLVSALPNHDPQLDVTELGCYVEEEEDRELSGRLAHFSSNSLNPARCVASCMYRGYRYAGLQKGSQCWCGPQYGHKGNANETQSCDQTCTGETYLEPWLSPSPSDSFFPLHSTSSSFSHCGAASGVSVISVYTDNSNQYERWHRSPADVMFVRGQEGEDCKGACQRASDGSLNCNEELFAILGRSCELMRGVGCRVGCTDAGQMTDVTGLHVSATPYLREGQCILGANRHFDCAALPAPDTNRACVCG